MDFLNKNQKVYIGEEEKKVFLEKLKRDVEVIIGALRDMILFLFSFLLFFILYPPLTVWGVSPFPFII